VPADWSGGVSALRHRRDRLRGKRGLLVTMPLPTPPRRWQARTKGVKQINMTICTAASTGVHSLLQEQLSIRSLSGTKRGIGRTF
jgi:hypothetical protein